MNDEIILLTKKGKPRKRKPKKKIDYFTEETQKAILKYRECTIKTEKDRIYLQKIHPAFYKLVENIIFTFGFHDTGTEEVEDLKIELISFLIPRIDLYKEEKGKAYSYFGTIVKRQLIKMSRDNQIKVNAQLSLDSMLDEDTTIKSMMVDPVPIESPTHIVYEKFICEVDRSLFDLFEDINELKAADAVLELFKKRENIHIFNKKALYIYVREMVDVESSVITTVIAVLKRVYKDILNHHIENVDQPYLLETEIYGS